MEDLQKTIHYTTKAEEICSNLVKYIPEGVKLIEPFVGDGDLLPLFPNHISGKQSKEKTAYQN